ncbi:hypothetical protein R3P38DRAFT_3507930 [Favolaschia claudopus]|uniref:Uncharacterized protein n=1 Tax=Favolaschia claudopus TaxID=2862362 RepID=A0AAW0BYA5_9AGAR
MDLSAYSSARISDARTLFEIITLFTPPYRQFGSLCTFFSSVKLLLGLRRVREFKDSSAAPDTNSSRRTYQLPDAVLAGLDPTRPNISFFLATTTFPPLRLQKIPFPLQGTALVTKPSPTMPLLYALCSREQTFELTPPPTRTAADFAAVRQDFGCCRHRRAAQRRYCIDTTYRRPTSDTFGLLAAGRQIRAPKHKAASLLRGPSFSPSPPRGPRRAAALYLRHDVSSAGKRAFW